MTETTTINRQGVRKRPLVWVKELVLYKSIDPVAEIRRLPFSMGLNIIQGKMSDSTEPFESGHGNGKTTVCRLIRYCLGEKTFGQNHVLEEVKHCFPDSYVGAIVEVDGSEWAILRPLGIRRKQLVRQGCSLSDLIESDESQKYEDFTSAVETAALTGLQDREVLTNGHSIQWLHILAMCSRDQESRYDLWWNWRHSRSESSTPKFDKPKVDAGLCVRSVLGLLDPEERRLRAQLERLESDLPRTRDKIKEKEAEPKLRIDQLRNTLKHEFGVEDADEASLEEGRLFGITKAAEERMESLRTDLAKLDEEIPKVDLQINYTSARLLELSETFGQLDAASEVTLDGTEVASNDLDRLRQRRTRVTHGIDQPCPYGLVTIKDCSYFQAHLANLDDELAKRTQETTAETSDRDQIAAELAAQAEQLESPIKELQRRLTEFNQQKNALLEQRLALNRLIKRLPSVADEAKKWNRILEGTEPHEGLQSLRTDETTTENRIEQAKEKLNEVVGKQIERAKSFASRFNNIVQRTINDEFKGLVDITEEGVSFRINRGNSLFGEAYETLAVLLADLALLAESSSAAVHHPGLLLHDSPREADLNLRIYERLFEVAVFLMGEALDGDDVPIQYIVTTTTPPSEQLTGDFITKHALSSGSGSLFGIQFETAQDNQQTLFDTEGDE